MTRTQLVEVMKYQLEGFNSTGQAVTEDTVHSDVLSDEGPGTATPKRIYKAFVRATLVMNGEDDPAWPADWIDLTVGDLADRLLPGEDL